MRRILIIALAMLVVPSTVLAQRGRRGEGRGMGARTQNVAAMLIENRTDLGLTDEVVAQLETLGATFDEETDSLRTQVEAAMGARRGGRGERGSGPPEGMEELRAAVQALQLQNEEFFENQVKPLLTEDQALKAADLIAASRAGRGRRGGRGGGR